MMIEKLWKIILILQITNGFEKFMLIEKIVKKSLSKILKDFFMS